MKVNEIFASIDGEGSRSGYAVTFVRLFGCNLCCSYCDTMYAVEGDDYHEMSVEEIMEEVASHGFKRITLTGGEPLLYPEIVTPLLETLVTAGYDVNIETNGAVPLAPFEEVRKMGPGTIMYTLDYKSISSGMNDTMLFENYQYLRENDVVKFVVGDEDDLEDMKRMVETELLHTPAELFVSPIFDDIDPADLVDFVLNHKLEQIRVQLQMHKFIWDPTMRGV